MSPPVPPPASDEPCPACCECCAGGNTGDCSGTGLLAADFPDTYCVYFNPLLVLRLWHRSMPPPTPGGERLVPVECGYIPRDEPLTETLYGPPAVLARRYIGCAPGPHYPGWFPIKIHRVKPTRWEGRGVAGGVPVCVRMVCTGPGVPMLRVYGPGWTGVMLDKMWVQDPTAYPPPGPVPPPARRVLTFMPQRGSNYPFLEDHAYAVPLGHSRGEYGVTHDGCEVLAPRSCSRWWVEPPPCLEVRIGDLLSPAEMTAVFGPACGTNPIPRYHDGVRHCNALSRAFGGVVCRVHLGADPQGDCGTTAAVRTGEGVWYGEFATASGAVYACRVAANGGPTVRRRLFCGSLTDRLRVGRFGVSIRHLRGGRVVTHTNPCCLPSPAGDHDGNGTQNFNAGNGVTWEGAEVGDGEPLPLPDCGATAWEGVVTSTSGDCDSGGDSYQSVHGRRLTVRVCDGPAGEPAPLPAPAPLVSPPPPAAPAPAPAPAPAGDCLTCGQQVLAAMEAARRAAPTAGPGRIALPRCQHLGGRTEFRADCLSGYGCRHACRSDAPSVAAHLAPHPGETTPSEDCGPDCPGYAPSALAWDWRHPTTEAPTET